MSELYLKAIEYLSKFVGMPLTKIPEMFIVTKIGSWTLAVHANLDKDMDFEPKDCMKYENAKMGELIIWFNGWIAGTLNPYGGVICAGKLANENTLIEAIEEKLREYPQ